MQSIHVPDFPRRPCCRLVGVLIGGLFSCSALTAMAVCIFCVCRATPRVSHAFTGYAGPSLTRDGPGGPSGTLALCVANTPIPCKADGMASQKIIQLTVLNIRKKGWSYAPW